MKPKIAVLITGQPRMIDYCGPKMAEMFDYLGEVDYFIQAFEELSSKGMNSLNPNMLSAKKPSAEEIKSKYKKYFNVKEIITSDYTHLYKWKNDIDNIIKNIQEDINGYEKCYFSGNETPSQYLNFMGVLWAAQAVNNLKQRYEKKNNFKYDLVIKTRSDIVFMDWFARDINRFREAWLNIPKKGGARHPICVTFMHTKSGRFEVGDWFKWGPSESFDVYLTQLVSFYYKLCLEPLYKTISGGIGDWKQISMSRWGDNSLPNPEAYWARLGLERGISFFTRDMPSSIVRYNVTESDNFDQVHQKHYDYLIEYHRMEHQSDISEWLEGKLK